MKTFEPVIGLEIHVELKTDSKMFCGCKNDPFFAKEPNIYTCPVCLAMPGGLPVPNKKAIEWTVKLGLALGCEIPLFSKFDRKNYFYPDLPKGYQITQYDQPFAHNGALNLKSKKIRIRRVHLEEDTGKLIHATVDGEKVTLIDFNRSGVPLTEIVTEPDFRSVEEVDQFVKNLQQVVRYLAISNADMEKGSMRIEPSVSIRTIDKNEKLPPYRVELKNINSFRFVRKALEYEIKRQTEILMAGEQPIQETRGWNETRNMTVPQREKESAHDYRYFPEPDIPPMRFTQYQISNIRSQISELPEAKKERFRKQYGLSNYDAGLLTETKQLADYFEEAVKITPDSGNQHIKQPQISPKTIANWLINRKIDLAEVLPAKLISQIRQTQTATTISASDLEKMIEQVIAENQKAVADYKKGKEQALMYLLGQIKRKLPDADARLIKEAIIKRIN